MITTDGHMLFLDPPFYKYISVSCQVFYLVALLRPSLATFAEHLDVDMLGVFFGVGV